MDDIEIHAVEAFAAAFRLPTAPSRRVRSGAHHDQAPELRVNGSDDERKRLAQRKRERKADKSMANWRSGGIGAVNPKVKGAQPGD